MWNAEEKFVVVQGAWDAWRTARVRACDLEELHWEQPSHAPRPLMHAYVRCSQIVAGTLPHECNHRSAPHRLLVCVLKHHTDPALYSTLAARIDEAHAPMFPVPPRGGDPARV